MHYAAILNDSSSIEILQPFVESTKIDSFNFLPTDYVERRELCSELFQAKDLRQNGDEQNLLAISDFLKSAFYPSLKTAIEIDDVEKLRFIRQEILSMGFDLKNFHVDSNLDDFCHGQRYIPLFFLAVRHRSTSTLSFFNEINLPRLGRIRRSSFTSDLPSMNDENQWIDLNEFIENQQRNETLVIPKLTISH